MLSKLENKLLSRDGSFMQIDIPKKTRKFLNEHTNKFENKDGDIPVEYLKRTLLEAVQKYHKNQCSLEFVLSLCGDIYTELFVNINDEKLYDFVEYLMKQEIKRSNKNMLDKEILSLEEYLKKSLK